MKLEGGNRLWDGEEDISEEFPPRAPKPVVQEGKLDKAAISWAKEAIDTMGSYTYEILLAFLGADPSYDSLDVIIKDSHKAARSLKQTLGSMFSKWEDAVMSDMRDNLEEEAARKFEQVGRDAHSDFMEEMHDIERHRMYLSLPANIDNALKDITRKLKTIRTYTPQTLAPFVRELNALLKMCNPRKQERRLQDICGDIENAASSLLVSFEEIVDGVDF